MIRIMVAAIALIAGGGAGWLALHATWQQAPEQTTMVIEAPKVEVLTPRVDLLRGAKLEKEHLAWTLWPAEEVNPGMILKEEQPDAPQAFAGRVLRSNLYSGEPIRAPHLAETAAGFLSLALQPGMRAVGVQISDEKIAGGFVMPNDKVDVLHTVVRDLDGDGLATGATRTILTNVRVLAIGQTTFDRDALVAKSEGVEATSDGATMTGSTATLEVSSEQGEVLLAAAASGQLSLALRAADDFGLSGIGDLAMIEGLKSEAPSAAEPVGTVEIANTEARHREVTIISSGVARTVMTASRMIK